MSQKRFRNRDIAMAVGLSVMLGGTVWMVTAKAIEALTGAVSQ